MPQVPHLNRFYPAIPLKELTSFYSVGNQAFPTTPASGNTPALTHRVAILSYLPKMLFIFDGFQYSNHYVLLLENLTQVNSISWEFQLYLNGMKKNNGSFLKAVDTNPFEYIIYFQGSITENNGQPKFDRLDITCTVVNGSETLTLKLTHDFAKATGVTHLVSGSQTLPFAGDPLTYNFVANQLREYLPNEQKVPPSLEVLKWNNQAIEIVDTENEALLFTLLGVLYYNIQTSKAMNGELTRSFEWKDFCQPALIASIETGTPYKGNFKIGLGMLPLHILSDAMPVNVNAIPEFANIASNHPLFAILSASGSIVYDEVAVETQHQVPPLLQQSKDRLLANQARLITLYHYAQFPKSAIRMVALLIKFLFECSQKNNCNECKKRTMAFTTATLTKLKEIPNLANNILTHYYREPYNKIKKFAPQAVKAADLTRSPYVYSLVHNVTPRILKAYFAKRTVHKVSDDYYEFDFERVDSEMFTDASRVLKDVNGSPRVDATGTPLRKPDWDNFLGRETYLVVETWGCKGRTVLCNLSVTPNVFTAGTNGGNLIVQVDNAFGSDIVKSLNQYDALFTNTNALLGNNLELVTEYLEVNHSGKAVIRLRLRPDTVANYNTWTTDLGNNRTSLSITARLTSNEACFFGNEIRQPAPNGRFLHAQDKYNNSCQYRLENRIVCEIHHGQNPWNDLKHVTFNDLRIGLIGNSFLESLTDAAGASPFRKVSYFFHKETGYDYFIAEYAIVRPAWIAQGAGSSTHATFNDGRSCLIDPTGFQYSDDSIQTSLICNTPDRQFVDISCFAGLLGAMVSNNIINLGYNGFSNNLGQSIGGSVSHVNGMRGDLRYLRTDSSGGACLLSDAQFDYDTQVQFNNSLHEYGWGRTQKMLSENFVYKGSTVLLPHCSHFHIVRINNTSYNSKTVAGGEEILNGPLAGQVVTNTPVRHDNHLHVQGFDFDWIAQIIQ